MRFLAFVSVVFAPVAVSPPARSQPDAVVGVRALATAAKQSPITSKVHAPCFAFTGIVHFKRSLFKPHKI
jgi:hypothetical protein